MVSLRQSSGYVPAVDARTPVGRYGRRGLGLQPNLGYATDSDRPRNGNSWEHAPYRRWHAYCNPSELSKKSYNDLASNTFFFYAIRHITQHRILSGGITSRSTVVCRTIPRTIYWFCSRCNTYAVWPRAWGGASAARPTADGTRQRTPGERVGHSFCAEPF